LLKQLNKGTLRAPKKNSRERTPGSFFETTDKIGCMAPRPPKGLEHYPGSKWGNGVYQTIINQIPPHEHYVEGCLGSGAILLNKRLASSTVGNDCNRSIIKHWKRPWPLHTIFTVAAVQEVLESLSGNGSETFVYIDPPYPKFSRRSQIDLYKYEMSDKDHRVLLKRVLKVDFNCMISTYPNQLYEEMLIGWRKISFITAVHGAIATEVLYMNYPEPDELHDYRYIGVDCWDRQRIKRKIKARVHTLSKLPVQERNAILHELQKLSTQ